MPAKLYYIQPGTDGCIVQGGGRLGYPAADGILKALVGYNHWGASVAFLSRPLSYQPVKGMDFPRLKYYSVKLGSRRPYIMGTIRSAFGKVGAEGDELLRFACKVPCGNPGFLCF